MHCMMATSPEALRRALRLCSPAADIHHKQPREHPLGGAPRHQERLANLLADTLVSPTRYMRAYLRQRGWRLPPDARVIPNVMPRRGSPAARAPSPDTGPARSALCVAHAGCCAACAQTVGCPRRVPAPMQDAPRQNARMHTFTAEACNDESWVDPGSPHGSGPAPVSHTACNQALQMSCSRV